MVHSDIPRIRVHDTSKCTIESLTFCNEFAIMSNVMNDTQTNTLENFKIYRDCQLSKWETIRPQIHATMSTFRNSLGRGLRDFGNCVDRACVQGTLNPKL